MYDRGGKIGLLDSRELGGVILTYIGGHRAKLYRKLGPHLEKILGSILYF
jgi:hypothetical protein